MNHLKKIICSGILLGLSFGAKAQISSDYSIGPVVAFLNINKIKTSPGIGLSFGYNRFTAVADRLDLLSGYYMYGSTFSLDATTDNSGNPVPNATKVNCFDFGINYNIGLNFYIIPGKLSVSAAPAVSVNYHIQTSGSFTDYIGQDATGRPFTFEDLMGPYSLNYGVNIGAAYRFDKHRISLVYCLGLRNLTQMEGYTANLSTLMLSYHFGLKEYSIAKKYQNKLLK